MLAQKASALLLAAFLALVLGASSARTTPADLHVLLVLETYSGSSVPHAYTQAELQASLADQAVYWHALTYNTSTLAEQVFTVTVPDASTYHSGREELDAVAAAVAAQPGGPEALAWAGALGLVRPVDRSFYAGLSPVTGVDHQLGIMQLAEVRRAITPGGAPVDWGAWMQEIGHWVQHIDGGFVGHPSGYADGYDLMDSCYPCETGLIDMAGPSLVDPTISMLSGQVPDANVWVVDGTGTAPLNATIPLAPINDPPTTGSYRGIKIRLSDATVPVGPGQDARFSSYYLLEQRVGRGPDGYGPAGIPRPPTNGVHIVQVSEQNMAFDGGGNSWRQPATPHVPCEQAPFGQRCAGLPGERYTSLTCRYWGPLPPTDYCWPFSEWQVGSTFHAVRGIDVDVQAGANADSRSVHVHRDATTAARPDLVITPWHTPPMNTNETVDLWIDSECNGYEDSPSHSPLALGRRHSSVPERRTVIGIGDPLCYGHENRVYAQVHNIGDTASAAGGSVHFTALFRDPGSTDLSSADLGSASLPAIPAHGSASVYVQWTPTSGYGRSPFDHLPVRITATVGPPAGAVSDNSFAQENVGNLSFGPGIPVPKYLFLPVFPVPKGDPAPRVLYVQPSLTGPAASLFALKGPASLNLPQGGAGGFVALRLEQAQLRKKPHLKVGDLVPIDVAAPELVAEDEPNAAFGAPGLVNAHGELQDAGSMTELARYVKATSIRMTSSLAGGMVTVDGTLTPKVAATVTVDLLDAGEQLLASYQVTTAKKGRFHLQAPKPDGFADVHVFWTGDATHAEALSWTPDPIPDPSLPETVDMGLPGTLLVPQDASITCPDTAAAGDAVDLAGKVLPPLKDVDVTVVARRGSDEPVTLTATTGPTGLWTAKVGGAAAGTWRFAARFDGDGVHAPALSVLCTTAVS